ncbi:hypothetical protein CTEN210_11542 [Chaetoceros tenuissimus]|uniref:Ionotropic glutamate receptor C-terminal domain-containing protein n=1 Tax=Chaetoceros tenuissimus TaxID=426638 RepID=A0AAD3H9D4_9STRA|nr:hypothetical protein CTEN210_11542 [Chaetoceros tenuissimus]
MISLILLLQAPLHLLRSISSLIEAAIVTDGPLLPNPDLYVEPFNTAVSYCQDFCDLQSKFHNGEVELRTAFQGRQINVNIGYDSSVINFLEDGTIDPLEPGIMIEVLDEVARRGGFTWIDSFVYEQAPPPDKSWTDLLVWSIATYDISVNWWFTTPERVALGASFPTAWYDAAQIIGEKQDVDTFDSGFDLLFWAKPFNQGVWWTLLGTMVLTGFVFLYVEEGTLKELSHSDEDNPKPGSIVSLIITYIHKSFLVVTGHLEVSPATHAGQVVSFSMAFFAVLIVSAYTANLASFLVVQKASNVQINTVNDIIKIGGSICVYKSTAVEDELRGTYGNAILVPKDDDKDVMMGVANR